MPKGRTSARNLDRESGAKSIRMRPVGLNEVEAEAFGKLIDAIAERRLRPGLKLVEEELAEVFSISRERIRRILLVLSQHGVVQLEPNKGASVARLTAKERRDAFEFRRLIEQHVAAYLAQLEPKARKEAVIGLRAHLNSERKAISSGDRGLQIRVSAEFHLKMAAFAGNADLLRALYDTTAKMSLALAASDHHHELDCSMAEHSEIVAAIAKGDADLASRLCTEHLEHLEDDLQEYQEDSSDLKTLLAL